MCYLPLLSNCLWNLIAISEWKLFLKNSFHTSNSIEYILNCRWLLWFLLTFPWTPPHCIAVTFYPLQERPKVLISASGSKWPFKTIDSAVWHISLQQIQNVSVITGPFLMGRVQRSLSESWKGLRIWSGKTHTGTREVCYIS